MLRRLAPRGMGGALPLIRRYLHLRHTKFSQNYTTIYISRAWHVTYLLGKAWDEYMVLEPSQTHGQN
jgi:hypothetical protein